MRNCIRKRQSVSVVNSQTKFIQHTREKKTGRVSERDVIEDYRL